MAQYLIVKFEVCSDQNECDGNRVPMFMTDDWDRDRPEDYDFEVYKLEDDRTFRFIGGSNLGNYDAEQLLPAKSEGMALTVWGDVAIKNIHANGVVLAILPAGGFITLGLLLALINHLGAVQARRHGAPPPLPINLDCRHCTMCPAGK